MTKPKSAAGAQTALDEFLGRPTNVAESKLDDLDPRDRRPANGLTEEALLRGLNPEQAEVVLHDEGPALVAAIAGSGKTRAVVHRIAMLVGPREIPAENILAVTFSKKAADEMNTRAGRLGVRRARVGTWHSLSLQIMREENPQLLDEWKIDSTNRFKTLVKSDVLGFRAMNWKEADLGEVLSYIGLCKANLFEPGTEESADLAKELFEARPCAQRDPRKLFEAYELSQRQLVARRLLTFDDMLVGAWKVLCDEEAREEWAAKWSYVIQDEAQDMNRAQETIGRLLAQDHRNYMLVGDPGQSIYGFRGSLPKRFIAFRDEWSAKTISMRSNYRSGQAILDAANGAIDAMSPENHLGTHLECAGSPESVVRVSDHENTDTEAEAIVDTMKELHEDARGWGDMTILYRTNAQSRGLEEALLTARIPYVVVGGTNFYDRKEVKEILSYLRVAADRNGFEAVKKCINSPFRFLGRAFVEGIEAHAPPGKVDWAAIAVDYAKSPRARIQRRQRRSVEEWASIVDRARESIEISNEWDAEANPTDEALNRARLHMPAAILERIVSETGFLKWLVRDEGSESVENNRVSNVRELIRAAERFTTVGELLDYIDENIAASKRANREKIEDRVTLMTVHRSKGLEWPIVFVAGASENIFPHGRAEDMDEERRLWYVAVTRAKEELRISSVATAAFGAKVVALDPSRFIAESGLTVGGE